MMSLVESTLLGGCKKHRLQVTPYGQDQDGEFCTWDLFLEARRRLTDIARQRTALDARDLQVNA